MEPLRSSARGALATAVLLALVCETWTWPSPLLLGTGTGSYARASGPHGARALSCGFRDALKKINPFGKVSKSEEVRRQWAALKTASSTSPVDMSALAPAPAPADADALPAQSKTSKLRQELAAREAERQRAWAEPVPTETAALFDAQTPNSDVESDEVRRRRQEAAAADMERVLGKKLLQQREREEAQPDIDRQERLEIARRAEAMQADMDRTLGRKLAREASEHAAAIRRTPTPEPRSASLGAPSPPPPADIRERRSSGIAESTPAPLQEQRPPMTVGEMRAKAAAEDAVAGYAPGPQAGGGNKLSLRNLMKAKSAEAQPEKASDGQQIPPGVEAPVAREKTFAEETAEMTAGKTVGDVAKRGASVPRSAWALPKYVTKRVEEKSLTPEEQQKKGRQLGPKPDVSIQAEATPPPPPQAPPTPPPPPQAPPKKLSLRELTNTAAKAAQGGATASAAEAAGASAPAPERKRLSLRELTKPGGKAARDAPSTMDNSEEEDQKGSREDEQARPKEDAAAALMRTLARRRTPSNTEPSARTPPPPNTEPAAGLAHPPGGAGNQKDIVEHVSRASAAVEKTRWKVVNGKGCTIHICALHSAEVVGQLKGFQVLSSDEEHDGWLHVCAPMFGWVPLRSERGEPNLIKLGKTLQG